MTEERSDRSRETGDTRPPPDPVEHLLPGNPERDDVSTPDAPPRTPATASIVTGIVAMLIVAALIVVIISYATNWISA